MSLSELEQHVFAYYVAGHANELNIATRWYPYGELVLVIEDTVTVAVRKFGRKPRASAKAVATAFLDHMIEKGAWATKQNEFGGQMHQFQADKYKAEKAFFRFSLAYLFLHFGALLIERSLMPFGLGGW